MPGRWVVICEWQLHWARSRTNSNSYRHRMLHVLINVQLSSSRWLIFLPRIPLAKNSTNKQSRKLSICNDNSRWLMTRWKGIHLCRINSIVCAYFSFSFISINYFSSLYLAKITSFSELLTKMNNNPSYWPSWGRKIWIWKPKLTTCSGFVNIISSVLFFYDFLSLLHSLIFNHKFWKFPSWNKFPFH